MKYAPRAMLLKKLEKLGVLVFIAQGWHDGGLKARRSQHWVKLRKHVPRSSFAVDWVLICGQGPTLGQLRKWQRARGVVL